ncbi:hypothetical protein FDP41_001240 [Naegleria fowleri]|uniref:Uncharacterized protein n=1 Tax=Naegleria fowleri TaxID=5763 RepID=A0A6A5BY67_NAEFO|nr:uncharacterized protein FDP41_001240 [Naegleria fowleri]KAF0979572.1 hypothetical protein FDP41_001240 [Naegleria fowleri]
MQFQPSVQPSVQSQALASSSFQKDPTNTTILSSQTDVLTPVFSSSVGSHSTIPTIHEFEELKKKYEKIVDINHDLQFNMKRIQRELEQELPSYTSTRKSRKPLASGATFSILTNNGRT